MEKETIVIAGSGPAGLTAAIYAARAGLNPLVIEGSAPGGQLVVSEAVENYPGFPEPVSGEELMARFHDQAKRFGVRFIRGSVESVSKNGSGFALHMKKETITARTLIIATGAQARRLAVPGESDFYGRGISGCVTCDGSFFQGKKVLVIGGGNTAVQDALVLSRIASHVTLIHRRNEFRAEPYELEKAGKEARIEWMTPWEITGIIGSETLTGATVKNRETGEVREVACDGIFVAIGHDPKTEAFRTLVRTDAEGYIFVEPGSTRTSAPGIFACGDVCDLVYRQAAVAAGQGCMAALDAQRYILKEKINA